MDEITLLPSGMSNRERARRADAAANERLILASAQRLFDRDGIDAVTMSAIAREAGVGKGTLYRAFANKGELCLALMDDDLRVFQEQTLRLLNEQKSRPPLDLLSLFLESLVYFMAGHAALMCEAEEHGALGDRPEIDQTSLHEWFRTTILLLLRRAEQSGDLRKEADLDYLADAILAPLNPRLIRHQVQEQKVPVDWLSQELIHFVMNGVSVS